MSAEDWLIAAVRVLVIISMIGGARRAWRSRHDAGYKMSLVGTAATALAMLFYLIGAVLLIAGYGINAYPRQLLLFIVVTIAYLWGGLWVVGKIAGAFEKRVMERRGETA